MFAYCENNPVIYCDQSGGVLQLAFAGLAGNTLMSGSALVAGTANLWNPIGWTVLGAIALTAISVATYNAVKASQSKAVNRAAALMDYASTAASPPPPNRGGKGTQVTSKTLYNKNGKNGFRIDVENPGDRMGQIHLQKNGTKYYYNVADKTFRIGSSQGELAPRSIQNLLNDQEVIKAIGKGLIILGY